MTFTKKLLNKHGLTSETISKLLESKPVEIPTQKISRKIKTPTEIISQEIVLDGETLLTSPELAAWLRIRSHSLSNWRQREKGPAFYRLASNKVRYKVADIRAWLLTLRKDFAEAEK